MKLSADTSPPPVRRLPILLLLAAGCIVMAVVELWWQPGYLLKSAVKIAVFLGSIAVYCLLNKDYSILKVFSFRQRKALLPALLLGLGTYAFILFAYWLLRSFIDFQSVTDSLTGKENITAESFLFVALYISFINSLLEELFFRAFGGILLAKATRPILAYGFSAVVFALYHIAIMGSWFSIGLVILLVIALAGSGLLFSALDHKTGTIYPSWILHMAANFAINTIGFWMFAAV